MKLVFGWASFGWMTGAYHFVISITMLPIPAIVVTIVAVP